MTNILLITSSPRGPASISTKVATALTQRLMASAPDPRLIERDVADNPPPFIDSAFITAMITPAEARSPEQLVRLALSEVLIAELMAADILVIGTAMINKGIPASLKSWIDHVSRQGVTFVNTPQGPKGLISGKKAYVVAAQGAVYTQEPFLSLNYQDTYLRMILRSLGIIDIETIVADGVAFGPGGPRNALAKAMAAAEEVVV